MLPRAGSGFLTPLLAMTMLTLPACGPAEAPAGSSNDAPAAPGPVGVNPAAAGFDRVGSEARAIELADATMAAMGGRQAWDETRFLAWNFFGYRFHVWDKWNGNLRVEQETEDPARQIVTTMNLDSREGRAWIDGEPVTDADELAELLQQAYEAWINDSYWLVMPYKLKDSGVTLTVVGEGEMLDGRAADVLQLTFEGVGVTPRNKYHVYVARDSGLVEQWDFFPDAADTEPRFRTPWHDWRPYGGILLSGDRGQNRLSQIAVFDELPASVFTSPEPTGLRPTSDPS